MYLTDYALLYLLVNVKQKFQDLEEERLDFTKSSLWTFANVASTVCVSDDGVSLAFHKLIHRLMNLVLRKNSIIA